MIGLVFHQRKDTGFIHCPAWKWALAAVLVTGCSLAATSQLDSLRKKNSWLAYPVAFHLPETGWGAGVAGQYNFRFQRTDTISPPSQVQLGFAYTQENQLLIYLPYNLFWNHRRHQCGGELGYYRYSYYFFGTGNSSPDDLKELYGVKFPRIRVNYLRKIEGHWYAGARYWYENYDIHSVQEDGVLAEGLVPGSEGSISSGPGVSALYDSRDNVYQTFEGMYLELVAHTQSNFFGSNYFYDRYRFDFRYFFRTGERQAIGIQLFGDFLSGSVPFSQMTSMGSAKRMRGYYEGRYRDKNLLLLQAEYRTMFWRKWGLVTFANTGVVSPRIDQFQSRYLRYAVGMGIRFRFDEEKRINLRLDIAAGKNSNALYFTVGEAF